jgi:hypothetical protein
VAAVATTALLHLATMRRALGPDEGGFAVVAQHWREPGPFLYGPLWVDRPPGIVAVFDMADRLGAFGPRLVATGLAVVIVIAVAWATQTVAGARASAWAAWTAAALTSTILLQAHQLTGELIATALVSVSIAALLHGLQANWPMPAAWGAVAGAGATAAIFVKQNMLGAGVFALVLAVALLAKHRWTRKANAVYAGFGAGVGVVAAAALAWAERHGGVDALVYAMFGFRADAAGVMDEWSLAAPALRLGLLLLVGAGSLMLPLAVVVAAHLRRNWRPVDPLVLALIVTVVAQLVAMLLGLNYWPHYLIPFIPVLALAVGLTVSRDSGRWTRRLVIAAAVSAAVVTPATALIDSPGDAWATGRWVARSAHPSDTVVVAYSHPNLIHASGLRPAYPYLWSLPTRTLDPHLHLMVATLNGPDRTTWFVHRDPIDDWRLDEDRQVGKALAARYRRVAVVCGEPIWLRNDAVRSLKPVPKDCGGGAL